jgi:hypothetical protein
MKNEFYRIGSIFKDRGRDTYILAQVDRNRFNLINLKNGNRYTETWEVENPIVRRGRLALILPAYLQDEFTFIDMKL